MNRLTILGILCAGILSCTMVSGFSAKAENLRNEDYISYDENGNPCCVIDGELKTGKFLLEPNYLVGDVEGDGTVNAIDASEILSASAYSGVSINSAGEVLADMKLHITSENQANDYADINNDGVINAIDASYVLVYAANIGAGENPLPLGAAYYYANADGIIQTGWITDTQTKETYYADEHYCLCTGETEIDGEIYVFDNEGVLQSGKEDGGEETSPEESVSGRWETDEDGNVYYIDADGTKHVGWLTLPEGKYYFDTDGVRHYGFLEEDGKIYNFGEDGLMKVSCEETNGTYDENGVFTKAKFNIPEDVRNMLDNAERTPGIRKIDVKNRQHNILYEIDPDLPRGLTFTDKDYAIIEKFAAGHFSPDMTLSECLYETWWWIHCNVIYARGELWNEICDLSYPDAVFNAKMGQCVQYNGAMAAVLAYYGYDVYMVKGWTNPDFEDWTKSTKQHYWTEVMIDGTRYYVETGNRDSNGDYWQYFFEDAENVSYTKTPEVTPITTTEE